ncbi:MAG: glycosyl transferase family 1, partial [Proteobacteria bacterium]
MGLLKILFLTKYGRKGASSRMRSIQYKPYFLHAGYKVIEHPLLSDELLSKRYIEGRYDYRSLICTYAKRTRLLLGRSNFDLIWIEKEAFPWWSVSIELMLLRGVP